MDLGTVLRWTADRYPNRRAVGGPHPMTYAQWDVPKSAVGKLLRRELRDGRYTALADSEGRA